MRIWTRDMDIEMMASGIGAEMHNWFVFCRKWKITTDESVSRMRELRKTGRYEQLWKDAQTLWKSKKSERELNGKKLQAILNKEPPASKEDREWLAISEW